LTEFAGEQEESRAVKLREPVELIRVQITKVDLGARRQRGGLKIFVLILLVLRFLLIPTTMWITARGHFFWWKEKFAGSFDEKLFPRIEK
jgi:hypothetical protein